MAWHTAAPGLTSIVAHDALHVSGNNLTDLVGSRSLALNGQPVGFVQGTPKSYTAVIGANASMAYSSAVTLPATGCTIFALVRARGKVILANGNQSTAGNYYLALDPANGSATLPRLSTSSTGVNLPGDTKGSIMAVAIAFTGTQGRHWLNGAFVQEAVSLASQPASSWGLTYGTPWGLNADLICLGIFNGEATAMQLAAIESAARTELEATAASSTVVNESFATAIPASGFGPAISSAGSTTVTYNAAAQAVDLLCSSNQTLYQIPLAEFLVTGEVSADLELTADTYGSKMIGLFLQGTGHGNPEGIWLRHYQATYEVHYVSPTWAITSLTSISEGTLPIVVGLRRTFKVKYDLDQSSLKVRMRFYVDDLMLYSYQTTLLAFRLGIYGYGCNVRIHSVYQSRATDLNQIIASQALGIQLGCGSRYTPPQPTAIGHRSLQQVLGKKEYRSGTPIQVGNCRITGTTKFLAVPSNTPVGRPVLLLREKTNEVVAKVNSDPLTGAYVFEYLPASERYSVIAFDAIDHTYRAVIADNLAPEPMP